MRTLQAQLQDIADWIHGITVEPLPEPTDFAEGPLRSAWQSIAHLAWDGDKVSYYQRCLATMQPAMAGYQNGPALFERIKRVIPWDDARPRPFLSLAEIAETLQPVTWLWPNWLPQGMITLLAAKPGTGKSMIALDLARRIIAGEPWPDGNPCTRPGAPVIYIDGENIPGVHNERALAWGMDRNRLFMLLADEEDVLLDLHGYKHQELLAQMVFRLDPALIIVDSLGSVMSSGENAVEDVRDLLGFLSNLAQHHGASVLLIHHLRKANGQLALFDSIDPDQIRGSGHITAMSRVAWGLTTVQTGSKPDPNGPRKLSVIKSNLSRHPEPLGIVLEPLPDGEHVRVVYSDNAPQSYKEPTERDTATEWLLQYLEDAGEPVAPKDVVAAAEAAGIKRAMVYRARETLQDVICNTSGRRHPANKWRLADAGEQSALDTAAED